MCVVRKGSRYGCVCICTNDMTPAWSSIRKQTNAPDERSCHRNHVQWPHVYASTGTASARRLFMPPKMIFGEPKPKQEIRSACYRPKKSEPIQCAGTGQIYEQIWKHYGRSVEMRKWLWYVHNAHDMQWPPTAIVFVFCLRVALNSIIGAHDHAATSLLLLLSGRKCTKPMTNARYCGHKIRACVFVSICLSMPLDAGRCPGNTQSTNVWAANAPIVRINYSESELFLLLFVCCFCFGFYRAVDGKGIMNWTEFFSLRNYYYYYFR